jgi:two-component system, OmpR family, response regulator
VYEFDRTLFIQKINVMSNTTALQRNATKKVLVVEDEGEMGLLLDIILNDKGFELDYVNNILSADEYLQKQQPSVIILDNKLPDGFGVDFISYIKKKYAAIKIIMISGFSSARDVALENGADMFFEKPFSKNEFYDSINRLVH